MQRDIFIKFPMTRGKQEMPQERHLKLPNHPFCVDSTRPPHVFDEKEWKS